MQALVNESVILESNDKTVTLTSHRIWKETQSWGQADMTSIMLEKISSIDVKYRSYVLFLVLGILVFLFSLFTFFSQTNPEEKNLAFIGMIAGGVITLAYFLTRHHVVTISSDGGSKIIFPTKNMKRESIHDFVNKIEQAKSERFLQTQSQS